MAMTADEGYDVVVETIAGELRKGYGDHGDLKCEVWRESDSTALFAKVECGICGSEVESSWIGFPVPHGSGNRAGYEKAAMETVDLFKGSNPESCREARKLNVIKEVMLS